MKQRNRRGFTLMEMLIVIAIIAVLVAIAIPTFSGSLRKARRAACMANCRSLQSVVASEYMLGEQGFTAGVEVKVAKDDAKYSRYGCPAGGDIYYIIEEESGRVRVRCGEHGSISQVNAWSPEMVTQTITQLQTYKNVVGQLDSTANSPTTKAAEAALLAQGIDLKALGAQTWKVWYDGGNMIFEWTPDDISKCSVGDKVTVMRYRPEGTYAGIYSVWEKTIENGNSAYSPGPYLVFGKGSSREIEPKSVDKTDLAAMLKFYTEEAYQPPRKKS